MPTNKSADSRERPATRKPINSDRQFVSESSRNHINFIPPPSRHFSSICGCESLFRGCVKVCLFFIERIIEKTLAQIDADAAKQAENNQPEITRLKSVITTVKAERERIFRMLLSSELSQSLVNMANTKIADLDEELSGLTERLVLLENQKKIGSEAHNLAKTLLLRTRNFAEALETAGSISKEELRQILLVYIQKVVSIDDKTCDVIVKLGKSSTKDMEWYTQSVEPTTRSLSTK